LAADSQEAMIFLVQENKNLFKVNLGLNLLNS